eukprot:350208-Chlamydomonas_euryale.AAC.18
MMALRAASMPIKRSISCTWLVVVWWPSTPPVAITACEHTHTHTGACGCVGVFGRRLAAQYAIGVAIGAWKSVHLRKAGECAPPQSRRMCTSAKRRVCTSAKPESVDLRKVESVHEMCMKQIERPLSSSHLPLHPLMPPHLPTCVFVPSTSSPYRPSFSLLMTARSTVGMPDTMTRGSVCRSTSRLKSSSCRFSSAAVTTTLSCARCGFGEGVGGSVGQGVPLQVEYQLLVVSGWRQSRQPVPAQRCMQVRRCGV